MSGEVPSYGLVQLGEHLGLARFQVDRARADGLIPPPDHSANRWSAETANRLVGQVEEIRGAVGSVPDLGAGRAARVLSEQLGFEITADTVAELATRGSLSIVGDFRGHPLYDGRTVERFTSKSAARAAKRDGRLLSAVEVISRLRLREADFCHLLRAGLLAPSSRAHAGFQKRRNTPETPLYRAGDITALAHHPGIDWDAVHATPADQHSPLANLPTVEEADPT